MSERLDIPADVESLGDAIRWLRTQRRMTLRALARAIEVSAPFLSDVEHNRRTLTDDRIEQVALALNANPVALGRLRGRLPKDLAAWIAKNPSLVDLLAEVRRGFHSCRCACPRCLVIGATR